MARFEMQLPDDIQKDIDKVYKDAEKIFGEMTKAGAKVALQNVRAGAPHPAIAANAKLTRTYKTPSDDGINTKVYISGWLPFKGDRKTFSRRGRSGSDVYVTTKGIPLDFLAKVFEYGRSGAPFPKRPFFRKAFRSKDIEAAMLKAQKKASGGLLE